MVHAKLSFVALAALLAVGSAQAANSSVQVEHLRAQLIDLDPSDGITPALTFYSAMTTVRVFEQFAQVRTASGAVGPFSAGDSRRSATAGSFGGDIFSASGWSASASSASHVVDWGGDATVHLDLGFTLTPKTLLLVTTDAPIMHVDTEQYEFAFADATLTVSGSGRYVSRSYAALTYSPNQTFPLQASFANLADTTTFGSLDLQMRSHTFTVGAPVPEPHAWALMLAGLGATGFVARRRRR